MLKKTLAGIFAGVVLLGVVVLADTVIFAPPQHAPSGTIKEYIPPPSANEDYKPSKIIPEDESILPLNPEKVSPEKTNPPTAPKTSNPDNWFGDEIKTPLPQLQLLPNNKPDQGTTTYFGDKQSWNAPGAFVTPDAPKVPDEFAVAIQLPLGSYIYTKKKDSGIITNITYAITYTNIDGYHVAAKRIK